MRDEANAIVARAAAAYPRGVLRLRSFPLLLALACVSCGLEEDAPLAGTSVVSASGRWAWSTVGSHSSSTAPRGPTPEAAAFRAWIETHRTAESATGGRAICGDVRVGWCHGVCNGYAPEDDGDCEVEYAEHDPAKMAVVLKLRSVVDCGLVGAQQRPLPRNSVSSSRSCDDVSPAFPGMTTTLHVAAASRLRPFMSMLTVAAPGFEESDAQFK